MKGGRGRFCSFVFLHQYFTCDVFIAGQKQKQKNPPETSGTFCRKIIHSSARRHLQEWNRISIDESFPEQKQGTDTVCV